MPVGERLLGPPAPSDRWRTAALASGVGLLAGYLRLRNLGHPRELVFDETYYAKDAWALLTTGVKRRWSEDADERVLAGDLSGLTDEASFDSHPPMGKWVIAAGELVDGLTPTGWRLGVAVVGTLAAVVMVYLARRVTRSTSLGVVAGLLVALDGLAIVTSRIAVLDGILMFFVLLAAALLVRDRDSARQAMARRLAADGAVTVPLWRPWRLLMGVALGLACATKWSGAPVLAVFGVLTVVWQAGALAQAGDRHPIRRALLVDGPAAFVTVVGSAVLTYLATWVSWFATPDGYARQWAAENPPSSALADLVPDALRSLWHYHAVAYDLLSTLDASHNWQSSPLGWLVLERPVLFYRDKPMTGESGCAAPECVADILALGTPVVWWVGVVAALLMVWRAAGRDDWRGWLVLSGLAATWLPWFLYTDRPIFSSYAIVSLPFLVLAIVVALRVIPDAVMTVGPAVAVRGQRWMVVIGVALVVATAVATWFFWPILVGDTLSLDDWRLRIWLPGWS